MFTHSFALRMKQDSTLFKDRGKILASFYCSLYFDRRGQGQMLTAEGQH
jgi:hypothetical protein